MALFVQSPPFMLKSFAASTLVVVVLFGGACSSETDSTFIVAPPVSDAAPAPSSPLLPEAGAISADAEAGPASCPPAIPETFAPTWTAPTWQNACTTDEIASYYTACLADPSTTEIDGACATFKAAHASCAACAEPVDDTGPVQWQLARKFYTLNVAGCIAVTQDKPDPGDCADAYNAAVECTRESCDSCFSIGGSFDQFTACQQAVAGAGICADYLTTEGTACAGLEAAGAPAVPCFADGTETQAAHFTRFVGLLCGPR